MKNGEMNTIWEGKDVLQDFDINSDGMFIISEMNNGVFLLNSRNSTTIDVSKSITREKTLYHRAKFFGEDVCTFITRSKKLYMYNIVDEDVHIIDANAIDYIKSGETIFIATRGREIKEFNIEQNQVTMKYNYSDLADSYISKIDCIDNQYIYISTKDGKIIMYERGKEKGDLIVDLKENITDFAIFSHDIYVVTDEGALYKGSENDGFELLFKDENRWGAIDVSKDIIALVSIEGVIAITDKNNKGLTYIQKKKKDYSIPYLTISGCTFKGVNTSNLSDKFINDLKKSGAEFD